MTPDVKRRTRRKLTVYVAALAMVLGLTIAGITQASAADILLSQGKPATASSPESAGMSAAPGRRRQHRHPLVQHVQRSAVDPGRPRRHRHHQPGRAAMGGRVRPVLPDPDLAERHHLDHRPLDHHRRRRHPDPAVTGSGRYVRMNGTARGHRLRLLACGSSRSTARSATTNPGGCGTTNAAQGRPATASLRGERRHAGQRRPSTATPAPAGRASSADPQWICRSTSAPRRAICQVVLQWEGAYAQVLPDPDLAPNGTTWTTVYRPRPAPAAPRRSTSPAPAGTSG